MIYCNFQDPGDAVRQQREQLHLGPPLEGQLTLQLPFHGVDTGTKFRAKLTNFINSVFNL